VQDPIPQRLVVAVTARALFALEAEEEIARTRSPEEYRRHQIQRDGDPLAPGRALPMVQALLRVGERASRRFEVVVLSHASADSSPRLFASAQEHALHVARAAFTGSDPFGPYLKAFHVDLFLSEDPEEVRAAIVSGTPAAVVVARAEDAKHPVEQIRIAFDGDALVFGGPAAASGDADELRPEGVEKSLAKLMRTLSELQVGDADKRLLRTALVTRRTSPAQEKALAMLRDANVRLDEAFFVGDLPREEVLEAFRAHVFFDDAGSHFRIPEVLVKQDQREIEEEAHSGRSAFARLRLRASE
jgi:5'-nucleotidase